MTNSNFFTGVSTLVELKTTYKKLAMIFHPDKGGDTETMKALNNEYEALFNIMKDEYNVKARAQGTHEMNEMPEPYREVILAIMELEGMEVELVGTWIWVSGNTKEHKETLKEVGFKWAKKKEDLSLWFWRPEEFKSFTRKGSSMGDIRSKYGSEKIVGSNQNKLK